ncbi:ankyrin repeat and protein kinase domain-containing protein 1-like [Saccoglossus kowalevskii]
MAAAYPYTGHIIDHAEISEEVCIGSGGFGVVYKASHKIFGDVAVKRIFKDLEISIRDRQILEDEAQKLTQIRSPYVVLLYGVVMHPCNYSLVLEYMCYGTLREYQLKYDVNWSTIEELVRHVILGIHYLHVTAKIVHRDVKIGNILVGKGPTAKVSDFGLSEWHEYSRMVSENCRASSESVTVGTTTHIPPECFMDINRKADTKFDVYSFGITIWEIVTKKRPYINAKPDVIPFAVINNQRPDENEIPHDCPVFLTNMMKECWNGDPKRRPTFKEMLDRITEKRHAVTVCDEVQVRCLNETTNYSFCFQSPKSHKIKEI